MPDPKRQTAYKVWISDLVNNSFVKQQGEWEPNFVEVKDKKVSRVNLIASITSSTETEGYLALTIDDGSGSSTMLKTWKEDTKLLEEFKPGDIVNIVGRIREYNNQKYITPELIKKLDNPNWELLRKLELLKEYGKPSKKEPEIVPEEKVPETPQEVPKVKEEVVTEDIVEEAPPSETNRQKIFSIIEKATEGIDLNELMEQSKLTEQEINPIIEDLLKEGEIFKLKDKFRLLG